MKTIKNFSDFYSKSKDRTSNNNIGRAACNEWLSFFTSNSSPRWLSAMTVSNLAMAMRNYQINKKIIVEKFRCCCTWLTILLRVSIPKR